TISQVEANIIYPSLPALLKMAEVLAVDISSVFQGAVEREDRIIFPAAEAVSVGFPDLPKGALDGRLLTAPDFHGKMEPYIIDIEPDRDVPTHFFVHKGEEVGYLLSGRLRMAVNKAVYTLRAGDVVYLTSEMPSEWRNPGPNLARLLWIKSR
ncbi:MAG: cupin domain-containing protein, partial [Thermodesulfobacteriota bacterium]|nr:cupin domain-containing protein [Thermodesulfobacteriota bacterium]